MPPKHTNPREPRTDRRANRYWAFAPYNFIPLPEKIVIAREPLGHERYFEEGLTGWIDCVLETCSPTFVRGMLTEVQFAAHGEKESGDLDAKEKLERAPFFQIENQPVIPGSSLRGMVRAIVEIIGFGRVGWVDDQPTFTFRAVAAPTSDPLRDPYRDALGALGSKVRGGYLDKIGEKWYVRPARTTEALQLPDAPDDPWIKLNENQIGGQDIEKFIRLNDSNYAPNWFPVSFQAQVQFGERGSYIRVSNISSRRSQYPFKGTLVCSGNMLETERRRNAKSPRKKHALILESMDDEAGWLEIPSQVIKDYRNGLTPFQRDALSGWHGGEWGCLEPGAPVFYVAQGQVVAYFGHSPNFRIPMRLSGSDRAATPLDFVPAEGKNPADPDLAEAIFGWVEEKGSGPKGQYASRVTFSNARLVNPNQDVWLRSEPSIPHTLSAPKPTTFQHYLIQSKSDKHDPNSRQNLAHYGTPPRETGIRGFKCYWHKGEQPDWEATAQEREHEDQLTRIMPLKPGVQFTFRIHFENLRPEELGVLWWALTLPGREGETYRHKLGMGKPLGMGAVAIRPTLVLSERKERYQTLLSTTGWEESVREAKADQYVKEFEHYVLRESGGNANRLIDVERIQMLLAMLQWPGPNPAWTRYMEIEHPISEEETINEYKERPVLPDPLAVIEQSKSQATPAPIVSAPIRRGRTEEVALPAGFQKGKVVTLGTRNNPDIGFIRPENGDNDVFFHRNQIAADSRDLKNGDRVRFKVIQGARGKPQARDIHRTK